MRKRRRNGNGNKQKGAAPRWLQILLGFAGLGVVAAAGAGITGFGVYRTYADDCRPPDQVIAEQPNGGAQIFDRNGNLLYEFIDDKSGLRSPVELKDISPWLIAATISTEDFSYWDNPGVNYRGLARAGLEYFNLREADASQNTGGSSITQQLVKNIYIPAEDRAERSVRRKAKETVCAIELTRNYDKDQILEWYLNQISYGGIYNGVEAASQGYFGKPAKDLTLPEAAMLAGIPAYPSEYDPRNNPVKAQERRDAVLDLMNSRPRSNATIDGEDQSVVKIQVKDDGTSVDLTKAMLYLSKVTPVTTVPARFPVEAPHFVFDVIQKELVRRFGQEQLYSGGLRVTTTIDLNLQNKAQEVLETWISEFEASAQGHNGALVAIDPETSEVLVMVGSRDYFRDDIQGRNNNATADNSPGSTLKPFAYAAAFEQLNWGTETLILDTPVSFPNGDEPFVPRNPSGNFQGPINIRRALGNSLNIPAVKTAAYVGVQNVAAEYKKFGMTGLEDQQDSFGPALVVGGIDVNLYDVTYAYSVFANNGVMRGVPTTQDLPPGNRELDPVTILQVVRESDDQILYPEEEDHRVKVQERRVIDARYAWMVNDILSDPNAHCITYGCGTLTIGREWGVKTGTSEPYENSRAIGETWTYGYTPDLVAGVWAGNSDNSPMYNITSTSISYRALRDFMVEALKDVPAREFEKPAGLKEVETCTPSGMKATPECPRRVKQWLPDTLKLEDDNWWKRARVDIRDGKLATELTPPQFIAERFGMVIPESLAQACDATDNPYSPPCFAQSQALEWQRSIGGGRTPTEESTGNAPVDISSPKSGAFLKNTVEISGKADSEHFIAYRVEWGAGAQPTEWNVLAFEDEPQKGGQLAEWDVRDVPDGQYTIRLVLLDEQDGTLMDFVTVNVGANERRSGTPVPTATPGLEFGDGD